MQYLIFIRALLYHLFLVNQVTDKWVMYDFKIKKFEYRIIRVHNQNITHVIEAILVLSMMF